MTDPNTPMPDDTSTVPDGAPVTLDDPTTSAFWESPSSYVTLATLVLPLVALIFHTDTSAAAQAVAEAAPLLAAVALVISRGLSKRARIQAAADLQQHRMHLEAQAKASRLQHQHELRMTALQAATPAQRKAAVDTLLPTA